MQRVVIVGGTHGNELGGIYLCRKWTPAPRYWQNYPFAVETYLANPKAIDLNQRYVDQDLNRSFRASDLANPDLSAYEAQRARLVANDLAGADFIVDLHNTTSNMGLSLIFSGTDSFGDPLTRQLCAHLMQSEPLVHVYHMPVPADINPYLPSLGQRELTLEVGPMTHGTLRADLFFKTEKLVQTLLDYLADWERGEAHTYQGELTIYSHVQSLDFPRNANGDLAGMLHPHLYGRDYKAIRTGHPLFITFEGRELLYQGNEEAYPVFINEQAYYEKHYALSLTRKVQIPI